MATITFSMKIDERVFPSFQPDQLTEEHGEIYEIIGRILALWNRVEFGLTYLTGWVHPAFKGDLPSNHRRPPRGLEAKIGLLRYLAREYQEFSIFKDELEAIFEQINAVKEDRHKIVHWAMHRFEQADSGLRLILTNPEKLELPLETYEMNRCELLALAKKLGVIGLAISAFSATFKQRFYAEVGKRKNT